MGGLSACRALLPPGWKRNWHTAVRAAKSGKLLAFISAIPADLRISDREQRLVEINFLCVHKKLRAKRLAPVLIMEITRRVHLEGIFQASFTAGVFLPTPVARCRYWHRSLNPKKLIDVRFSQLHPKMTMAMTVKMYKVPDVCDQPPPRRASRR
jgi:glycylpeptide N-tetradecanoyltransferase